MHTSKEITNEIWKDIANYDGIYQVSNLGGIRRTDGKPAKIRKDQITPMGYVRLRLHKNGVGKFFFSHVLVGRAFIPNPKSKPTT